MISQGIVAAVVAVGLSVVVVVFEEAVITEGDTAIMVGGVVAAACQVMLPRYPVETLKCLRWFCDSAL